MKKSLILGAVSLLLISSAVALHITGWLPYSLDERVTVQFPTKPQEIDLATFLASQGKTNLTVTDKNTRMYMAADVVGVYQVIRVDMNNLPDASPNQAMNPTLYYEGVISGALKPQDGVLLTRSSFQTPGGEGVEIKYRGLHKGSGKHAIKYMRSLLVGKVGYTLNFVPKDQQDTTGTSGNEQRQQFFQSLAVKASPQIK